ncbi:MAG: D-inositol-3-phosphate glycosyltransferase [Nitrospirae bacterium]|nr:D-inositol-3-phosphate glycosyltransferase [Nitrospirota bacterium]QOJ36778.1 MAG: glycosyltransferase family 4 protein [Nitrospira sp.]
MKVLVISAAYPPMHAGEATNTYHLCQRLVDRGVEVHVLTSVGNRGTNNGRIHVYPIMREWGWAELLRVRSFIRSCEVDAFFLMYIGLMYKFHPMVTFLPTLCKRLFRDIPFVTRYESAFVGADPSKTSIPARVFRKLMVRWAGPAGVAYSSGTLLRDSDAVIALCERHRAMLTEEWPAAEQKVVLIPPPPNLLIASNEGGGARARGRQRLGLTGQEFVVTFFGYLYPIKGIETLLRAFAIVAEKYSHARLLFVGGKVDLAVEGAGSYFDEMQRLHRTLGLESKTIWTGAFKSEEEEASLYLHASDVSVLPFLEGVQLNNSSFASLIAHGLPVIVTRGPMMDGAFVHGENVLTCAPRDHEGLAELLLQVMNDGDLRTRLQTGALKFAQEWFSWESAVEKTIALMRSSKEVVKAHKHYI